MIFLPIVSLTICSYAGTALATWCVIRARDWQDRTGYLIAGLSIAIAALAGSATVAALLHF